MENAKQGNTTLHKLMGISHMREGHTMERLMNTDKINELKQLLSLSLSLPLYYTKEKHKQLQTGRHTLTILLQAVQLQSELGMYN